MREAAARRGSTTRWQVRATRWQVRATSCSVLLIAALAGSGCSTRTFAAAPDACVEGQTAGCSCADGSPSLRHCGADSAFGACQCGDMPGAGAASGGASSTAANGAQGGTSGGAGGVAGAGNGGGMVGGSGAAGASGSAGESGAEAGGSAGEPMAGVSGGTTGGTTAGASGDEGGEGGNSGTGNEGGGNSEPMPAATGEQYGPCLSDGSCANGLFCVTSTREEISTSYCTSSCASKECPAAETGNVPGSCVFDLCLLQGCQKPDALCPLDMSCQVTSFASPSGTRRVTQCVFD